MIIKTAALVTCCLLILGPILVSGQVRKKKPNSATEQFATTAVNDTATSEQRIFLFPEFYHFWPADKNDTMLKYDCYNDNNMLIITDTLENINSVQHIYFVKSFTNYMHTYIDPEGKPKPSVVTKTIYRYDRAGENKWKSYDVENNFLADLTEYKNEIVRSDTTFITSPGTGDSRCTIRKYYRVVEQKTPAEGEAGKQE